MVLIIDPSTEFSNRTIKCPLHSFLERLEWGKLNCMVIAPRQLQCAAARPRAAVEMPQPPTSQAWLAAPQVAFLSGPGVRKNPPEQEVPRCSPVTSRWKVGLLLMEMVLTDLQSSRVFPTQLAASRTLILSGGDAFFFFIKSLLLRLWKFLPTLLG